MTIICTACGYDKNPDGAEFCDACGAELTPVTSPTPTIPVVSSPIPEWPPSPTPIPTVIEPPPPISPPPIVPDSFPVTTKAKLIAKQSNAPVREFEIGGVAVIGVFDPDTGPVDIDLEGFQGGETVSRNHGEIYSDNGVWTIKDLGSSNGIFIKPAGQSRFNARITVPTPLRSGDEVAIAKVIFTFQSF